MPVRSFFNNRGAEFLDTESQHTKGRQVHEELLARHPDGSAVHSALDKMGT